MVLRVGAVGIVAAIVPRSLDAYKGGGSPIIGKADGNGRKETKKGGRKVREIGTSSDLGSKRKSGMHAHGNVPFNGLFFNRYEMEAEFDLSHHFLLFHYPIISILCFPFL